MIYRKIIDNNLIFCKDNVIYNRIKHEKCPYCCRKLVVKEDEIIQIPIDKNGKLLSSKTTEVSKIISCNSEDCGFVVLIDSNNFVIS